MSGYVKLFSSILESTVWLESPATKVLWITLLAMADRYGVIEASIPGLAKRAGVTVAECEQALARFLAPDTYSRTKDYDGRRIELVAGGWRLLNHELYRHRESRDDVLEKAAARQQQYRDRHTPDVSPVEVVTERYGSVTERYAGVTSVTSDASNDMQIQIQSTDPDPESERERALSLQEQAACQKDQPKALTVAAVAPVVLAPALVHERGPRGLSVFSGSLPRDHLSHFWCDPSLTICVPVAVHAKFLRPLMKATQSDEPAAVATLTTWYAEVAAAQLETFVMGDAFRFWVPLFDAKWASPLRAPPARSMFATTVAEDVAAVKKLMGMP